jgi:hypothetical protein
MLIAVFGENKSGKSAFAEGQLERAEGRKHYLATLPRFWFHRERILRHQLRRPADWKVLELTGVTEYDEKMVEEAEIEEEAGILDGLSIFLQGIDGFWSSRELPRWLEGWLKSPRLRICVDAYPPVGHPEAETIRAIHSELRKLAVKSYDIVPEGRTTLEGSAE